MTADTPGRVLQFDRSTRSRSGDAKEKTSARPGSRRAGVVQGWTSLYQLRVTLRDVEPPIWRRIQVPGTMDLASLHVVIQAVVGWPESHVRESGCGEWIARAAAPGPHPPTDLDDERTSTLEGILTATGDSFIYASGLGDDWIHVVEVEEIRQSAAAAAHALCLGGARACPPEDSDGPSGYAVLLTALSDPFDEGHAEAIESIEGRFDPERFDLEETNRRLARLPSP